MIYDHISADRLLGCLIKDTSLANSSKYKLKKDDFQFQIHQIVYVTLHHLGSKGCGRATYMDIDLYISPHKAYYNTFLEYGEKYIDTIQNLANIENIDYYYECVRKTSLLRDMEADRYDISEYWNKDKSDEDNLAKLEKYSLKDIITKMKSKLSSKEQEYIIDENVEEYKAGFDFKVIKESLKENPIIGASFQNPYLNTIHNGLYGLMYRSGKSGSGKTVATCGDICNVSVTHYWDDDAQDFIPNPHFEGGGLILNTEMKLRTELDFLLVAWISNVDRKHIRKNKYDSKEQEDRVDRAGEILANSPLYLIDVPDFTMDLLERKIEYYVLNKGVLNVAHDYVQTGSAVNYEISKTLGIPAREDLILGEENRRLKLLQNRLNINILTGSQLNGQEDNMAYPTESCLAGGKGQIRKPDGCNIMLPPTKAELLAIEMITNNKRGFDKTLKCNRIEHIVKGRANEFENEHIKVAEYLNLGTGRVYPICVMNKDNEPLNIPPTIIKKENN